MSYLFSYLDAKYVHVSPYGTSGGSLRVYIPKIMPQISMGTPKNTPVGLNSSCYINASDCKPSISGQITTQNYVTAKEPYHPYEKPCYFFGREMIVSSPDEDWLTCRLAPEELDNSVDWP